jgi:hypothetical protein
MTPRRLTIVPNELEAEMVCALLRSAGIECGHRETDVAAGLAGGQPGMMGPREVLVAAEDLERAQEVLSASDS